MSEFRYGKGDFLKKITVTDKQIICSQRRLGYDFVIPITEELKAFLLKEVIHVHNP